MMKTLSGTKVGTPVSTEINSAVAERKAPSSTGTVSAKRTQGTKRKMPSSSTPNKRPPLSSEGSKGTGGNRRGFSMDECEFIRDKVEDNQKSILLPSGAMVRDCSASIQPNFGLKLCQSINWKNIPVLPSDCPNLIQILSDVVKGRLPSMDILLYSKQTTANMANNLRVATKRKVYVGDEILESFDFMQVIKDAKTLAKEMAKESNRFNAVMEGAPEETKVIAPSISRTGAPRIPPESINAAQEPSIPKISELKKLLATSIMLQASITKTQAEQAKTQNEQTSNMNSMAKTQVEQAKTQVEQGKSIAILAGNQKKLEHEVHSLKAMYENQVNEREAEIKELREGLKEREAEIKELREGLKEKEREIKELREGLDGLGKSVGKATIPMHGVLKENSNKINALPDRVAEN